MTSTPKRINNTLYILLLAAVILELALRVPLWNYDFLQYPSMFRKLQYAMLLPSAGLPFLLIIYGYLLFSGASMSVRSHLRRTGLLLFSAAFFTLLLTCLRRYLVGNAFLLSLRLIPRYLLTDAPDAEITNIPWILINLALADITLPFLQKVYRTHFHHFRLITLMLAVLSGVFNFSGYYNSLSVFWFILCLCLGGVLAHYALKSTGKGTMFFTIGILTWLAAVLLGYYLSLKEGYIELSTLRYTSPFTTVWAFCITAAGLSCRKILPDRNQPWPAEIFIPSLFLSHGPICVILHVLQPIDTLPERSVFYAVTLLASVLITILICRIAGNSTSVTPRADSGFRWIRALYGTFILVPFFALLLPTTLRFRLNLQDVCGDGNAFIYLTQDNSLIVKPTCTLPLKTGDTRLGFTGIQDDIEYLCLDPNNVDYFSIKDATLLLRFIPVYHYSPQELMDAVSVAHDVDLSLRESVLSAAKTGPDDFIILQNTPYFSGYTWLIWLFMLFVPASITSVLTERFLPALRDILPGLWPASAVTAIMVSGEILNHAYSAMLSPMRILNVILVALYVFLLIGLTHFAPGTILACVSLAVYYIANHYVHQFRGRPVMPSDIGAAGTALGVARSYDFALSPRLTALLIVLGLTILLTVFIALYYKIKLSWRSRGAILSISAAFLASLVVLDPFAGLENSSWNNSIVYAFRTQGALPSFIRYAQEYHIRKPSDYSAARIKDIIERYPADSPTDYDPALQPERILMIMNESFADLPENSTVPEIDTMPFVHQLSDNCVKGHLYVSVQGGGTCNTEFETLTGNSMAFLPANTYPYVSYIKQDIFSLGRYFSALDYGVASLHLENPEYWYRTQVYQNLGLEPFYSLADYSDFERINSRASDAFNYQALHEIEESISSERKFLFNVTVQNHGGYTSVPNLDITYDLSRYGEYPEAAAFFSLMKLSDQEIERVVKSCRQDPVRTMIIFYGDHQPAMASMNDVREWLYRGSQEPIEQNITPFFIWCNYDIPSYDYDRVSANYMPYLIAKIGNFPLPACFKVLERAFEEYPVITAVGAYDKNGTFYSSVRDIPDESGILSDYQCMQYNLMIDKHPEEALWLLPDVRD